MELEFFEPRPPKIAAIKLDFLDESDSDVAEKLTAMPGVTEVAIEYGYNGRQVVVDPRGDKRGVLLPGYWLVCTAPPPDLFVNVKVEMLGDRLFQKLYRRSEQADTVERIEQYHVDAVESVR